MNCPDDKSELVPRSKRDITLYQCPSCRGLWLPIRRRHSKYNLKTLPTRRLMPCLSCGVFMSYESYKRKPAYVCSPCQHAWLQESAIIGLLPADLQKGFDTSDIPEIVLEIISSEAFMAAAELGTLGGECLGELAADVGMAVIEFFAELI